jgi:hypothetical protein
VLSLQPCFTLRKSSQAYFYIDLHTRLTAAAHAILQDMKKAEQRSGKVTANDDCKLGVASWDWDSD